MMRFCFLSVVVLMLTGFVEQADMPLVVSVRSPCSTSIEGREVAVDEMIAIARQPAGQARQIKFIFDDAVAYKCIGGLIYRMQLAGFGNFTLEQKSLPQSGT